ncbi:MAG: ABC transporter ATP-binding protein, partial [Synergistaceae bacterium]|nr:ABC transporter ATP-binding protein [Synergistaceae bacterium]
MHKTPLYELTNIVCAYEDEPVLQVDSLAIPDEGPVAFVGHNGSGKSTLLKLLSFLLPQVSGELRFLGETQDKKDDARLHATLLLQEPYLLRRSVFENIAYGLRARGEASLRERVVEALEMVGLSADFARREWYQLSGGEARRVALASRLALRTRVLLLDEPTANVDEENAQLMAEAVLDAWKRWNTTPLIATHDLQWLDTVT